MENENDQQQQQQQQKPSSPLIPRITRNPKFLNLTQAAVYLGLSYTLFRQAVEEGKIPHRKVGKRFLFNAEVLDEWAKGQDERASEE